MTTLLALLVLLSIALWTRRQVRSGSIGWLRHLSAQRREGLAKFIDLIFMALAVLAIVGTMLWPTFNGGTTALTLAVGAMAAILMFKPVLNDLLGYGVLQWEGQLREGDYTDCGDISGQIQKRSLRTTWIRTMDGGTVVVPNNYFLTHPIHHWGWPDRSSRITLHVEANDRQDPTRVKEMLLDCAREVSRVEKEPLPDVMFLGWRNRRLHFQLRVWIVDRALETEIASQLNYLIFRRLRTSPQMHSASKGRSNHDDRGSTAPQPQQQMF